jgi:hypothetical protein
MIFISTIGIPLFTHGAGGEFFVGKQRGWWFHHPFEGGRLHVTAQAEGWSLLSLAGVLQISFLLLGFNINIPIYFTRVAFFLAWRKYYYSCPG